MKIGYACITIAVPDTKQKNCTLKNADEKTITALIQHNLNALENIIDYNIKNGIWLFRISSDLIPFGSSPVNTVKWWDLFDSSFRIIGKKIKDSGMRVSMHPGQYTVINSTEKSVVEKSVLDLNYHTQVLDSLGLDAKHKIVLHIGGVYQDKKQAVNRFIMNYQALNASVKERLVIENDDKSYNIEDVLDIGQRLNIPVIFDNLHHQVNPPVDESQREINWINECRFTWKEKDGEQKIHYSQQAPQKKAGSHSNTIRINEFMGFYERLGERKDIDIMLEVKDKNLSAVKCINCIAQDKKVKALEFEWSKYKYKVLENSHEDYLEIRKLLSRKGNYLPIPFYNIIEDALQKESNLGNSVNAVLHVWGYFKNKATPKEKEKFLKDLEAYKRGERSILLIKNFLWKLALKYQENYLLESYYFVL